MAQTEINTFSAAVDTAINRCGRPDRRLDAISYMRLSMRETQVRAFFFRDMIEDTIDSVGSDPYSWDTPDYFRQMQLVQYPHILDGKGNKVLADPLNLGKRQLDKEYFYYGSGDSIVFVGHGLNQAAGYSVSINVAYFSYFAPLAYFPTESDRPARYLIDDETGAEGWEYNSAYDDSDANRTIARDMVTNWMLTRWFDVVLEGGLAKLYKTQNDERSVSSFALFKQLQTTILASESRLAVVLVSE